MMPVGRAKRIKPKLPSLKPKSSLISGIRLAQLAKLNPAKKKKTATAIRWVDLETGMLLMSGKDTVRRTFWPFPAPFRLYLRPE